jgi:hypothetical protein
MAYRVTAWPDVQFECRHGTEWMPVVPSAEALRGAARVMASAAWRAYREFLPADARELMGLFRANRLAALQVAARCPEVVGALIETPALTAFVFAHASLRGAEANRWPELNAVYERGGVFGLLEWLGLPASRQTLTILANLVGADVAPHLIEPLRTALWRPQGILALAQLPSVTEQDLTDACALAA